MKELSPRQRQILQLICAEIPQVDIAKWMGVSVRTVNSHVVRMREKTGASGTAQLVRYAIRIGLIRIQYVQPICEKCRRPL